MLIRYNIFRSLDGALLAENVALPARIERISKSTAEGHFLAGEFEELTALGLKPNLLVYAFEVSPSNNTISLDMAPEKS